MFKRGLRTTLVLVALMAATVFGSANPSFADSGGGCGAYYSNVKACISVTSGTTNPLKLDFYLSGFSGGECYAAIAVIYNNSGNSPSRYLTSYVSLTGTGRYGPWSETKGLGSGQAKTLVTVYNCAHNVLYNVYSPNQSW